MGDVLNNIILAQKQEIKSQLTKNLIERDLETHLRKALTSSLIKVITGPRRAGKSVLALQCLMETNFGYINFEDNMIPQGIDTDELINAIDHIYGNPKI